MTKSYRFYVEYKEQYMDDQQRYLYIYAKSKKQIKKMFCEYEVVAIDCTEVDAVDCTNQKLPQDFWKKWEEHQAKLENFSDGI